MTKSILLLTLLVAPLMLEAQDKMQVLSPAEMQSDFLQMRKLLEQEHWALYYHTPKIRMDSIFDKQYALITDSLPVNEFFKIMTPVIAAIGCGHTNIWMPGSYWRSGNDRFFPVQIRIIDNKIVANGTYTQENQIPRGSIIHSINGRTAQDILNEMLLNYPSSGCRTQGKISSVQRRFPMIYVRRTGFPEVYTINYSLPKKKKQTEKTLSPATEKQVRDTVFRNFRTPDLKMEYTNNKNIAILTINTFGYYDRKDFFKSFLDSCFTDLEFNKTDCLILDLRGNDGGDPFCSAPLFSYLIDKPLPYFRDAGGHYRKLNEAVKPAGNNYKGKLLVLMDSRCFSTNSHFCSLLKYHNIGTIIGTPSGGNYICSNTRHTNLDNSAIMVYYGTRAYATAVDMDRDKPIMPDITIKETYRSFLKNKDLFMETAMKIASKK